MNEVRGGSAYGAGTLAGADGSRQPSKLELDFAQHQVRCALCWVLCLQTNGCLRDEIRLQGWPLMRQMAVSRSA